MNNKQNLPPEVLKQILGFDPQAENDSRLKAAKYPAGQIPRNWLKVAVEALRFASPMSTGIKGSEFVSLINMLDLPFEDKRPRLTMWEFMILSNNLEATSYDNLNLITGENNTTDQIIIETERLVMIWNAEAVKISEKLTRDIKEIMDVKQVQYTKEANSGSFGGNPLSKAGEA